MKNLIRLGLLGETSILMLSCMCHALNQFDVNYFNLHPCSLNVSRGNQNCFSQFINFLWKILCNYTELWFFFPIKSILIHEYQQKSTRINTSQHNKSDTNQHEATQFQHESTRVRLKSIRINTTLKRVNTSPTQVSTNQHESRSVLDESIWVIISLTRV